MDHGVAMPGPGWMGTSTARPLRGPAVLSSASTLGTSNVQVLATSWSLRVKSGQSPITPLKLVHSLMADCKNCAEDHPIMKSP